MNPQTRAGRLSTVAAALVVARRDFRAVLWSRSFVAFLAGPLFMLVITALASGVGQKVEQSAARPVLAQDPRRESFRSGSGLSPPLPGRRRAAGPSE